MEGPGQATEGSHTQGPSEGDIGLGNQGVGQPGWERAHVWECLWLGYSVIQQT